MFFLRVCCGCICVFGMNECLRACADAFVCVCDLFVGALCVHVVCYYRRATLSFVCVLHVRMCVVSCRSFVCVVCIIVGWCV